MYSPIVMIEGTQLTSSVAVYYTAPALSNARISQLVLTNADTTTPHSVTLYLAPGSGSPDNSNLIINKVLAPKETYVVYQVGNLVIPAAGTIQAIADTSAVVTIHASGVLIT